MISPATAVEHSANTKTGLVSATFASQSSCPECCPLLGQGCYAESGHAYFTTYRLNKSSVHSPERIAIAEARAIDGLTARLPLRLHVVGDCATPKAAEIVARACVDYRARRSMPVWGYTHAWRSVARRLWANVAMLASCETLAQVRSATKRGYATALVVAQFPSPKAYTVGGIKLVPCPAQTHADIQCVDCRLCWDDAKLLALGVTIAFSAHGARKKTVSTLIQLKGNK